ncbi:MAG: hypothetical protein WA001_04105 [Patescibacteria group bacterium]
MNTITSSDSTTATTKLSPAIILSQVMDFKGGPALADGLVWAIMDRIYREMHCVVGFGDTWINLMEALKEALIWRKSISTGDDFGAKQWATSLIDQVRLQIIPRHKDRILAELAADAKIHAKPALKPIKVAPPKKPRLKPVAGNSFQEKLATLGAQAS